MSATIRAEIHFHQQDHVSVFWENALPREREREQEILIMCLFALRQLGSLGRSQPGDGLATLLTQTLDFMGAYASGNAVGDVKLTDYVGTPGRKQFVLALQSSESGRITFDVTPKGFGFLGTGLGYYAPTSVISLLRFLARRRANQVAFALALGKSAEMTGAAHLAGKSSIVGNQVSLAISIVNECVSKYLQDEPPQSSQESQIGSDSVIPHMVDQIVGFYTIATQNGYRMGCRDGDRWLYIWNKKELATQYLAHRPGDGTEQICHLTGSEWLAVLQDAQTHTEFGLNHLMLEADENGGRLVSLVEMEQYIRDAIRRLTQKA